MSVQLVLKEEMIECFNKCTEEKNYKKFLEDYQHFIKTLVKQLKETAFLNDDFCRLISQNAQSCFNYLAERNPEKVGETFLNIKNVDFSIWFMDAVISGDWNDFYLKYRPEADFIIAEARRQKKIDFLIEYKSEMHDNFVSRDLAAKNEADSLQFFEQNPGFKTVNNDMKNMIEQRLNSLELRMEKTMDAKIAKICRAEKSENPDEGVQEELKRLNMVIMSVMSSLENTKKELKKQKDVKFREMKNQLQAIVNAKLVEQKTMFDAELASQMTCLKQEILEIEKGRTGEMEKKLQEMEVKISSNMKSNGNEIGNVIQDQLSTLKTEIQNSMEIKMGELDIRVKKMKEEIKIQNGKLLRLEMTIERLQEEDSSESESLEDLADSDDTDSDLEPEELEETDQTSSELPGISGIPETTLDDDMDDLQRMQEEFQRNLLIQNKINEEKLERIRQQRAEMNKNAEEQRKNLLAQFESLRKK